jgi:hypothetical protein
MTEKPANEESHNLYEFEILKQRYESLEKTLTNVEKEKDYYQVSSSFFFRFRKIILCLLFSKENLRTNKKRFRTY